VTDPITGPALTRTQGFAAADAFNVASAGALPPVAERLAADIVLLFRTKGHNVYCHAKDRRKVTNKIVAATVALQSPAECNAEPLRGMSNQMTSLSKRTRSTNMWILLQLSSIAAVFEFVLNKKVRDIC